MLKATNYPQKLFKENYLAHTTLRKMKHFFFSFKPTENLANNV